jgi:hypothetical protein
VVHYAVLNDHSLQDEANHVLRKDLYGHGGRKIAHVCDIVFDHGSGDICYLVADCGHDRRVLIPPTSVTQSQKQQGFVSEFSSEDLARLPVFTEAMLSDAKVWRDYEQLYRTVLETTQFPKKAMQIDRGREPAWRDFEQRLRQELRQIRRYCAVCSANLGRKIA